MKKQLSFLGAIYFLSCSPELLATDKDFCQPDTKLAASALTTPVASRTSFSNCEVSHLQELGANGKFIKDGRIWSFVNCSSRPADFLTEIRSALKGASVKINPKKNGKPYIDLLGIVRQSFSLFSPDSSGRGLLIPFTITTQLTEVERADPSLMGEFEPLNRTWERQ